MAEMSEDEDDDLSPSPRSRYVGKDTDLFSALVKHAASPSFIRYKDEGDTVQGSKTVQEQIIRHGSLLQSLSELQDNLSFYKKYKFGVACIS